MRNAGAFSGSTIVKKIKVGPLAKALLETAGDMRKAGLMDKATH